MFLEGVLFHACWADQQLQQFGHTCRCHCVRVVVDQVFPHSDVRLCKKKALPPNVVHVCAAGEADNYWSWPFVVHCVFFFQADELHTVACCLHADLGFEGYSSIHPSRCDANFHPLFVDSK